MTKRISMKHWMKLYTFCLWIIIFGIYIYWKCSLVQLNCYLYKNCSSFGEAVCIFKVKLYRCIPFTLGLTIAAKSTITIVIDSQKYYHNRLSIVDFAIAINYHDSFDSLQTTFFLIMVLLEQCRILPSSLNAISKYSVCPDLHEARLLSRISAGCEYSGISYF
mgnify:CR=1 FL=1